MNYLLFFTIILPFLNFFLIFIKKTEGEIDQKFAHVISKICAISYVTLLFGLLQNYESTINLTDFGLVLKANIENIKSLFLVAIIWLILTFYSQKLASSDKTIDHEFVVFLAPIIGFLNILILSQNLITLFFAQFCLTLLFSFIFYKFLLIKQSKKAKIFIFLLFCELILLFLTIILINYFMKDPIFFESTLKAIPNSVKTSAILTVFLPAILLTTLSSSFFLYHKDIDFSSRKLYLAFLFAFCLPKIIIFSKIITKTFSIALFSLSFNHFFVIFLEILFAFAIISSLILILFSRDFRAVFFYLTINQLAVVLLSIFALAYSDIESISQVFTNFILAMTLAFFVLSNIVTYFKHCQNKSFDGIFTNFKITISLLIFVFLNFAAIAPPMNFEIVALMKICLKNQLFISFLVLIINAIGLFLFIYKLVFPTFCTKDVEISEYDQSLAKKIDFSSQLSLTACIIAFIMIILPIIKLFL